MIGLKQAKSAFSVLNQYIDAATASSIHPWLPSLTDKSSKLKISATYIVQLPVEDAMQHSAQTDKCCDIYLNHDYISGYEK